MKRSKIIFGLFGTGGCARGIMPFARDTVRKYFEAEQISAEVVFVETKPLRKEVNGNRVLSEDEFLDLDPKNTFFNVGIADSKTRESIVTRCLAGGLNPLSLQASDVAIYDNNQLGRGAILCARTMITSNVKIGKFFHANIYSYVEHDCIIGDFVTFAPRVNCNGNVHIGNYAYIGTGAVLRQGTSANPLLIGESAIIGMGAVVTKNVPPGVTVVGNPARPLENKT